MREDIFTYIMMFSFGVLFIAMTYRITKAILQLLGIDVNDKT